MLIDLFPRAHARYTSLPLLGTHLEGFACWLREQGFSPATIRLRVLRARALEADLQRQQVRGLGELSCPELMGFAPPKARDAKHSSALVRSLAVFLETQGILRCPSLSHTQILAGTYRDHLTQVRGYANRTADNHAALARELLGFLRFEENPDTLRTLGPSHLEAFVKAVAARQGRPALRNTAARLRSFLRFLAAQGQVATGLDALIDTPLVYRGETLPRALPWDSVRALLAGIDRSAATGRRDYAMLLLAATYGLRSCEVVGLQLEDFRWRSDEIRVRRPKTGNSSVLPLTDEVGVAIVDYLRNARPASGHRGVFLGIRPPIRPLAPASLWTAFDKWKRHCEIEIPFSGAHCLRHSLAMQLLRRDAPLEMIGDLLAHRRPASTSTYLRLSPHDLREAALELPVEEDRA